MDHLQSASQGSPTTPSKMLTQHTGDPLGGRTYQRQCSEGCQQKQLHHNIDATPTWTWTGRIVCMPNTRLPKQILCSQLNDGRRGPRWAEETFSGQRQDQPVEVLSQWTTGSLSLWKGACGMKSRTKAQLLMSLNYVMSQTQSDNSKKKDGQKLQPHHTLMWPPQPSQDPPGAPSEDRHTRFRVTADDFVSARLQLHKSRT